MTEPGAWILAIDMGTTSTVVATRVGDRMAEVVEVDGQRTIPSTVFVDDDGSLPVGTTAVQLGAGRPDRAVRAPKRRLDVEEPIVVGGRALSAAELVAALLRHGSQEAIRMHGSQPSEVRLTHPVAWPNRSLARLREASVLAGLGEPRLIPEPIAAAHSLRSTPEVGERIAIYDLGGETFDTVALEVTADGFTPVSKALGSRAVGGELLDEMIMAHVGERVGTDLADQLLGSEEPNWIRANTELRRSCRAAKESISSHPYAEVAVMTPAGLVSERLARSDIERLAAPLVDETVSLLARVIEAAGGVEMIHLVGGGSRLPIVTETIRKRWPGLAIGQTGDPRVAVALGAASVSSDETSGQLVIESERVTPPTPPAAQAVAVAPPTPPARPQAPGSRFESTTALGSASTVPPTPTPTPAPAPTPIPVAAGSDRAASTRRRLPWLVAGVILLATLGFSAWALPRLLSNNGGSQTAATDSSNTSVATASPTSDPSDDDDDRPNLEPNLRRFTVGNGGFIDYVVSTTDTNECPRGELAARDVSEVEPGPPIMMLAAESELVGGGGGWPMLIIERCNREVVSFQSGFVIQEVLDPTTVAPLTLTPEPLFITNLFFDPVDELFLADARFERGTDWRSVEIDVTAGTVNDLGPSPERTRVDLYPGGLVIADGLTGEREDFLNFGSSRSSVSPALFSAFLSDGVELDIPESCAGIFDEVISYGGLALGFRNDEMLGWFLQPAHPNRPFTRSGIGIASHMFEIRATGVNDIETFTEEGRQMIRFKEPEQGLGFDDYVASVSGTSSVDHVIELYAGVHCEEMVFRFR